MIVAKFYDGLFNANIIAQCYVQSSFTLKEDLNEFDYCEFEISYTDGIAEDTRVEIAEVENGIDTLIFSGFIYEIEPRFDKLGLIRLICRSQKALFLRRRVLSDKTFTTATVESIINDLIGDYVTTYNETRTLTTDITASIDLNLNLGDNYYDILNEIAEEVGAFWNIVDGNVVFQTTLGTDRTFGSNYEEIVFNGKFPSNNNIRKISLVGQAKRSNIVIGIDQDGNKTTKTDFSDGVVYGVDIVRFRTGGLSDKTQQALDKSNTRQRVYKVEVETNAIEASTGDTIRLSVANTTPLLDIDTSVVVVKRTVVYDKGGKRVDISVSDLSVRQRDANTVINDLQKDIEYLQL